MITSAQTLINYAFRRLCAECGVKPSEKATVWDDGEAERWLCRIAAGDVALDLRIHAHSGEAYPVLA